MDPATAHDDRHEAPKRPLRSVALPRRFDGIARALRATFRDGGEVPEDIEALLARLNRITV